MALALTFVADLVVLTDPSTLLSIHTFKAQQWIKSAESEQMAVNHYKTYKYCFYCT